MERRSSKRYSIGTSINFTTPNADSTHLLNDDNIKSAQRTKRKPTSPLSSGAKSIFRASSSSTLQNSIDSLVYTDAQSKGLASRIVKYHANNQKPQSTKSLDSRSWYDKPGQLPLVHLKKAEIKYVPKRSSSSIRIAPPKKSMFRNNVTRPDPLISTASVIMSSSSVPVTKPKPTDSTEKKTTENEPLVPSNESTSSKSALEELKEISRKRINSEELDVDRYKKQCKDLTEVDGLIENIVRSEVVTPVTTKRGRETSATAVTSSSSAEQLKKKLCTKNNDILSSLSSSTVLASKKRSIEDIQPRPVLHTNVDSETVHRLSNMKSSSAAMEIPSRAAQLPQKTYSEPVMQVNSSSPATKAPKLTLFNKKYEPMSVKQLTEFEEDEEAEHFIVPMSKIQSPVIGPGKEILRRVEKSKLSLMLSCLNEDLEESDVTDAPKESSKIETTIVVNDAVQDGQKNSVDKTKTMPELTLEKEQGKTGNGTGFQLPDTTPQESNSKEVVVTTKVSSVPQLSTANLISFSPSPFEKSKDSVSSDTALDPKSNTVSFSAVSTPIVTLPAPKMVTLTTTTSDERPKATLSFETASSKFGSEESGGEFAFGKSKPDETNTVSATIKLPIKPLSFGNPAGAKKTEDSTATTAATVSFGNIEQNKSVFGKIAPNTLPTISSGTLPPYSMQQNISLPKIGGPPPLYQSPSSNPLSGIVFGGTLNPQSTTTAVISMTSNTTATTSPSGGFNFGKSAAPTASFSFGNAKTSETGSAVAVTTISLTNSPAFGYEKTAITPAPSFSFGREPPSQTTTSSSALPSNMSSFGTNAAKLLESSTSVSFSTFGSSTSDQKILNTPRSGGFNFGASAPLSTPQQPMKSPAASLFGNIQMPASTVGNNSVPSPNFSFSSQPSATQQLSTAQSTAQSSNIFGSSISNSSTAGMFGQKISETMDNKVPISQNIFGSASNNNAPVFGGNISGGSGLFAQKSDAATVFGRDNNKPPAYNTQTNQSANIFGNAVTTTSSNLSQTYATPSNQSANIFGNAVTTMSNNPPAFSFGGSSNPIQTQSNSGFTFGGSSSQTGPTDAVNKSFSFSGSSVTSSQSGNMFGNSTAAPAMSFGKTEAPGAFNFSTGTSNINTNTSATPFAFKGPSNDSSAPANLFPAFGGTGSALEKPAAFNFGGATPSANPFGNQNAQPNLFGDMNTAPNPFNIGGPTGGGQQQLRRTIRQGTRRLNK